MFPSSSNHGEFGSERFRFCAKFILASLSEDELQLLFFSSIAVSWYSVGFLVTRDGVLNTKSRLYLRPFAPVCAARSSWSKGTLLPVSVVSLGVFGVSGFGVTLVTPSPKAVSGRGVSGAVSNDDSITRFASVFDTDDRSSPELDSGTGDNTGGVSDFVFAKVNASSPALDFGTGDKTVGASDWGGLSSNNGASCSRFFVGSLLSILQIADVSTLLAVSKGSSSAELGSGLSLSRDTHLRKSCDCDASALSATGTSN
mmetsp:Transcript_11279/g.15885  ORF Transcript_11279/g.15885 Transcript_11279/m.15885 type:complete len:257 (-) Transcript_11279:1439-2209(-)